MGEISTIGLDIAKSVFQVHGVDVDGTVVIRGSGEPVWVNAYANACLRLGPDPRRALGPAATSAASTGRTRDRTRPMLHLRQKSSCQGAVHT
jgi:hypothetical protein